MQSMCKKATTIDNRRTARWQLIGLDYCAIAVKISAWINCRQPGSCYDAFVTSKKARIYPIFILLSMMADQKVPCCCKNDEITIATNTVTQLFKTPYGAQKMFSREKSFSLARKKVERLERFMTHTRIELRKEIHFHFLLLLPFVGPRR